MRSRVLFVAVFGWMSIAYPLSVNKINGGGSLFYVDFSLHGRSLPVQLVRTYNSITAVSENNGWPGAFGWGWTALFETSITTTPDRMVILRDGASGNTVIFKAKADNSNRKEDFIEDLKKAYFTKRLGRQVSPAELAKLEFPAEIAKKLKTDTRFRLEMALKYGQKGPGPTQDVLISSEYGYQTLRYVNKQWVRERDGISQYFDDDGRLVKQKDRAGASLFFKYNPKNRGQLIEMSDDDRTVSIKLIWRQDRIVEAVDNQGKRCKYAYDRGGNLIHVVDSASQVFGYRYENKKFPHLLTRIDYVSESKPGNTVYREMSYDDGGLLTLHREKDGSIEQYSYGKSPEGNLWTKTSRTARGAKEEQFDEFVIKTKPDGNKFLFKQETRKPGLNISVVFTTCCGKPQQITRNGAVTKFKYSDDGLLLERMGPSESLRVEYDSVWKKVSRVNFNGLISQYDYDKKGNLKTAFNSNKQKVALQYDSQGRITRMLDPKGKQLNFAYSSQGKPNVISEKGVGTIIIDYDLDGRVQRTRAVASASPRVALSRAKSAAVVREIMSSFQTLLDIIRPASVSVNPESVL